MSINNDTAIAFLLQLLSKSESPIAVAEQMINLQPQDWEILLEQAKQRDLTLLLYDRLQQPGLLPGIPQNVMDRLRSVYLASSARNAVMLHHAGQILRALRSSEIEVIVLKGLYLIESVYSSIGLRTFVDLDLLVSKSDVPATLAIMQELGYKLSTYYDAGDPNTDIKHIPPMIKDNCPYVEIHWGILEENEPFTINIDELWQRAVPARVADVDVLSLSTEDLTLHLCLHFTYQHKLQAGIKFLFDIAEVITLRADQIDWHKLISTAREWQAERVVWLTFQLLKITTGVTVHEPIINALQPVAVDEKLVDIALRQILTPDAGRYTMTPDLVAFATTPGIVGKIRRVFQRIFIPRRVLARLYNRDPKSLSIYAYYGVRFVDLFRQYAPTVRQFIKRQKSLQTPFQLEQDSMMLREWMNEGNR